MVRNVDGSGQFFHNKKGVAQGDPLSMISYVIGILPLISGLCSAHLQVTEPWYTDDAIAEGKFDALHENIW